MLRWAAIAFAATAVGASSAQAMPAIMQDGGYVKVSPVRAPATGGGGFDWTYVEAGVGSAAGLVVLVAGALAVRRSRSGQPARA